MFNLFPVSLLIMALGGIVYIVSDHLSEFSAKDGSASGGEDETDDFGFNLKAKLAGWINRLPLDDLKIQSLSITKKLLHKTRIVLLKTDNHVMKLIGKISKKSEITGENGLNENSADFWKDISDYKQETSQNEIPQSKPEVKIDLILKSNPVTEKFFDIKPAVKTTKIRKSKTPR